MQITIEVQDSLVDTLGYERVIDLLTDSASRLEMKIAAQEILQELSADDPVNDPVWLVARQQAWEQEKPKYVSKR